MNKRFLGVLIVGVLALSGCGGSSKSGGGTGTTGPTTATFLAQLNSLCVRANNAFAAAHATKAKASVVAHYVALFRTVQAPTQLKALYARYVAVLEQESTLIGKGNLNAMFAVATKHAEPLIAQIGAKQCITSS